MATSRRALPIAVLAVVLAAALTLPACGKTTVPTAPPVAWEHDVDAALSLARAQHKPVLVYFGASWDTAAKELEYRTFTDPLVRRALGRDFVSISVDATDDENPYTRHMQERFRVIGDPTVIILGADADTEIARFNEFVAPAALLRMLDSATREDAVRSAKFTNAARARLEEARREEERRAFDLAHPPPTAEIPRLP